jgi:hypothetical protein
MPPTPGPDPIPAEPEAEHDAAAGASQGTSQPRLDALRRAAAAGALTAGRAIASAAVSGGQAVASAYRAVDPDLRRHLVHAPLVGIGQLLPRRRGVEPLAADGHRVVIFVHGMAGDPGNFYLMQTWFSTLGRTRSYAPAFAGLPTVVEMAEQLRAFVDDVVHANRLGPGDRIDLVAHSQGGLVSRTALLDPGFAARIATLVTLGTPHGGTHAARYAATPQTLGLRPDSPILRAIATQLPWPGPPTMPRLVTFWSDADLLLLPHETALVEGADVVSMPGFTHLSYLLHPRSFHAVWQALASG